MQYDFRTAAKIPGTVNYIRTLEEPGSDIIIPNLQKLILATGDTVTMFFKRYENDYGVKLKMDKIYKYKNDPIWTFSFMYVRALEIGLILIYGYKIRCFDLIRYDFSKDPLPGIIPVEFRRLWVENKIDRDSV